LLENPPEASIVSLFNPARPRQNYESSKHKFIPAFRNPSYGCLASTRGGLHHRASQQFQFTKRESITIGFAFAVG